ncbi:MAG: M48 family metallopeptidase [Firmicutes bacterium]|nr:M48 family metallopeptidase [Bacillota bacterium]
MRQKLFNLDPQDYEHPFDRKALNALRSTPGLEPLVRKFNQYGIDKILKVNYTGSNIKVNERNFPEVHAALNEVVEIISPPVVPDLYIRWDFSINAFTAGVEKPIIVLNSGCLDLLDHEELLYLIGHEVGHIKSQHVLYHQMAQIIPLLGSIVGDVTLGFGRLISTGLQIALLNWQRMSEFTADRAGLLACQNVTAASNALVKMAGLPQKYLNSFNVEEFIAQAKEFEDYDFDTLDKVAKVVSIMLADHPWIVMRAAEFYKWIESGEYDQILNKCNSENGICKQCGFSLGGTEIFCPRCGNKI